MSPKLATFAFLIFAVGLGLVIWIFLRVVAGIKERKVNRFDARKENWWLRAIALTFALILIALSQGILWFNSNLRIYMPLDPNIPLARISFYESENERPRMILATFDEQNHPLLADEIFVDDSLFQIEVEILRFKKLGQLFGLQEVYRFSRLLSLSDSEDSSNNQAPISLGSEEVRISDFVKFSKKMVALAYYKRILTDPFRLDRRQMLELSYTDVGLLRLTPQLVYGAEK